MIHSKLFIIIESFTRASEGVCLESLKSHGRKNWNVLSNPSNRQILKKNKQISFTTNHHFGMCCSNPPETISKTLTIFLHLLMIYPWKRRKIRSLTAKNRARTSRIILQMMKGDHSSKTISHDFNFNRHDWHEQE